VNGFAGQSLIALAVAVFVVFRFARRELVERVVSARTLWIRPAVLVALTAYLVVLSSSLDPSGDGEMLLTLAAGGVLGVITGALVVRYTRFRAADRPWSVRVQGSRATFGIWIGALAVRLLARYALPHGADPRAQLPLNCGTVALVAAAFVVIAIAFYAAIRRYGGPAPTAA
jgi:Protein of unknown function (DUF1453)